MISILINLIFVIFNISKSWNQEELELRPVLIRNSIHSLNSTSKVVFKAEDNSLYIALTWSTSVKPKAQALLLKELICLITYRAVRQSAFLGFLLQD